MKKIIYSVSVCLCSLVLFACTPQASETSMNPVTQDPQTNQSSTPETKQSNAPETNQTDESEASNEGDDAIDESLNETSDETSDAIIEATALTGQNWTRQESGDYFDQLYTFYFFEDGTFASNDGLFLNQESEDGMTWYSGTYDLKDATINLTIKEKNWPDYDETSGQMELTQVDMAENSHLSFDVKVEGANLKMGHYQFEAEQAVSIDGETATFMGDWERTNVHSAQCGSLSILKETPEAFYFSGDVGSGANMGSFAGLARKINADEAIYYYEYTDSKKGKIYIKFKKQAEGLTLESNGSGGDLGLGFNVFVDGDYTQGQVTYTNENMLDSIMTESQVNYVKKFLGEDSWTYLEQVIDFGYNYDTDGLTYSGFISGAGQGGDFILDKENHFNYLSYGEGPGQIFYTNQSDFKNKLPRALLPSIRTPEDMAFIYRNEDQEVRLDQYLLALEVESYQIPNDFTQWGETAEGSAIILYTKGDFTEITYVNGQGETLYQSSDPLPIVIYGADLETGKIIIRDREDQSHEVPLNTLTKEGSYYLEINQS